MSDEITSKDALFLAMAGAIALFGLSGCDYICAITETVNLQNKATELKMEADKK